MQQNKRRGKLGLTLAQRVWPVFVLIIIFLAAGCTPKEPEPVIGSRILMGTLIDMKVYGKNAEKAMDAAFEKIKEIESKMSVNLADSEISLINENAGKHPVQISASTYDVLEKAFNYARITSGSFDPTVGPLVSAWGIGGESPRVPTKQEIKRLTGLIDWRTVELDAQAKSVYLPKAEMALDLGAIAKGYAADEVAKIFRANGIKSAYVSLGGNVYVIGDKPNGKPWRIGIRNPFDSEGGTYVGIISISDTSLVTSGTYERFFVQDGVTYHHILDTKSGYPAESDLASVTIVAPVSMDADGLSTSVFVLGKSAGEALITSLPNVDAILVDKTKKVWVSPNLRDRLQLSEGFELDETR